MRYFLDTEFIEDGRTIDLLSLALVAEDGREFYALNLNCQLKRANPFVRQQVLPHLPPKKPVRLDSGGSPREWEESLAWMKKDAIRDRVIDFCDPGKYGVPEFWADYCSYDWVALCQLFGTMSDLPDGYPFYCNDLRQLISFKGFPEDKLPPQPQRQHHALFDARWVRDTFSALLALEDRCGE